MAKTWLERFDEGLDRDDVKAAKDWATCYVGEKHAQMPDVIVYTDMYENRPTLIPYPADTRLRWLGHDFFDAVNEDRVEDAMKIMRLIDDRVDELKRAKEAGCADTSS